MVPPLEYPVVVFSLHALNDLLSYQLSVNFMCVRFLNWPESSFKSQDSGHVGGSVC